MGSSKITKPPTGQPDKQSGKTHSAFLGKRQEPPDASMRASTLEIQHTKAPQDTPKTSSSDKMKEILARSSGKGLLDVRGNADQKSTVTSPTGSSTKETKNISNAPHATSELKLNKSDQSIASAPLGDNKKPGAHSTSPKDKATAVQIASDEKLKPQQATARPKGQKSPHGSSSSSSTAATNKEKVKVTAKAPQPSKKAISSQKQPGLNTLKYQKKPLTGSPVLSTGAPKVTRALPRVALEGNSRLPSQPLHKPPPNTQKPCHAGSLVLSTTVSDKANIKATRNESKATSEDKLKPSNPPTPNDSRVVQAQPPHGDSLSSGKSIANEIDETPSTQKADQIPASSKETASFTEDKGYRRAYAFQYNSEIFVSRFPLALPDSGERWASDSDEPQLWIGGSIRQRAGLNSFPWSEVRWAQLWCMSKHFKSEISGTLGIQAKQFTSKSQEVKAKDMPYDVNYRGLSGEKGKEKWCKQCRKILLDPNSAKRPKGIQHLERRLEANAETAIKEAKKSYYRKKVPGVVGSTKEIVYDLQWDPECQIETMLWTEENRIQFRHDEEIKWCDERTKFGCWGHKGTPSGTGESRIWSCCGRTVEAAGCHAYPGHELHDTDLYDTRWHLYETPKDKPSEYRQAVVIDCQMGKNDWGQDELIKLTAIDYFSGQILIDNFVWPSVKLLHTDRWHTGVEWSEVESAHQNKTAIEGRDAARELLLRNVGDKTVLIMFDGRRGMLALRLIHHHIIDAMHIGNENPRVDIDTMAHFYLRGDAPIRNIYRNPLRNSLEDAITTRNLVHQIALNEGVANVYGPTFGIMGEIERRGFEKLERSSHIFQKLQQCHWPRFPSLMASERQISRLRPLSTQQVPYLTKYLGHDLVPTVPVWIDEDGKIFDQKGLIPYHKPPDMACHHRKMVHPEWMADWERGQDSNRVFEFLFTDRFPEADDYLSFREYMRPDELPPPSLHWS